MPVARSKRRTEQLLAASTLSWLSLRMPPFTEVWLALVGSELPLRGEERTTLGRPYPTLRRFRRVTGRTIERRGVMVVPGPPSARQAFLSVHDAAAGLAAAVRDRHRRGPGRPRRSRVAVLDRRRGRSTTASWAAGCGWSASPPVVFAAGQRVLAPVAPSLAGVMGLNRLIATSETDWDTSGHGRPARPATACARSRRSSARRRPCRRSG